MNRRRLIVLGAAGVAMLAACNPTTTPEPESCSFTANAELTVYRLPDSTSDVFGMMAIGESYPALARTADGWIGFDPGIAQAGNIGLAHHRWVFNYVDTMPSCLDSVELVTLEEVMADIEASG